MDKQTAQDIARLVEFAANWGDSEDISAVARIKATLERMQDAKRAVRVSGVGECEGREY